jgi:hypothetical protein
MRLRNGDSLAKTDPASRGSYTQSAVTTRSRGALRWRIRPFKQEARADPLTFLWLVPLSIAAVYLIVFLVKLPHNITALSWNADYASEFVLPETLVKTGTSGNMVMASAGQWVPLWFGLLTTTVPLHRELWGVAPTALFVTAALVVGWSVSRIATRRTAVLSVLLSLIASPLALAFFMAPAHTTVYISTALLGAYLVWLARARGRRRLLTFAVPPLVGVAIGVCLASDTLGAATAVVPLSLTAILAGLRRERRSRIAALSALATVAVAVPIAKLTTQIMHSLGFLTLATPAEVVPLSELPQRAELLFKGLKTIFNGSLGPQLPGTLHTELGVASDVVMSAALLTLLCLGAVTAVRFIRSGLRKEAQAQGELAYSLHVIYWVSSAAAACGAFWLAGETGGGTDLHESYYGTVIFSVAAVVPLLLTKSAVARRLIPVGATVIFVASLVGLTSYNMNLYEWVTRSEPTVAKIAAANHVTVGYSGYLAGSTTTWNTHGRLTVRPLMACPNSAGADACPFYMASVPSWYTPARRHTFLLTDPEDPWVGSLPSGLGKPLAVYAIGAMRMYIYPYNIASRLGPEPD